MSQIIIYADGACSNNQESDNIGGWGAILLFNDKKKEIYGSEKNTTNNKMELTACIKALQEIKIDKYPVSIYTDSAYIVNCFKEKWYESWKKKNWHNSKKQPVANKDLWVQLISLSQKYKVTYHKVAGHSGIDLNERADQLAQLAIKEYKNNLK